MSSCITDVSSDQLCYIPCNFCNIVLAVSVPCSNLLDIVTVRCGHCTHLWTVNMAAAFHSSSSLSHPDLHPHPHPYQAVNYNNNQTNMRMNNAAAAAALGSSSRYNYNHNHNNTASSTRAPPNPNPNPTQQRVVNRPPEKRQRVPSAYNQFIKEEIQRIKSNNPDITHREAFSTAAKNWAHFPHIHFGLMLETSNQLPKLNEVHDKHMLARTALLNN